MEVRVNTNIIIRKVAPEDYEQIFELYKIVAKTFPGQITQYYDELLTVEYIKKEVIENANKFGLMLVLEDEKEKKVIGILKGFTSKYRALAHVLNNVTMMIHPDYERKGYGSKLMNEYCREIAENYQHIHNIRLLPHETNSDAIKFYEKHNFTITATLSNGILNPDNKTFTEEVILVWGNPNFNETKLYKYHKYLKKELQKEAN